MDGEAIKKQKKGFPGWARITLIVIGSVILAIVIAIVFFLIAIGVLSGVGSGSDSKEFGGASYPYIAKIKVVGSIGGGSNNYYSSDSAYHHDWTLQTIDTLIEDENNRGVFLWLDTPGGTVYESDELYLKLIEYKEKTGRPVYSYMGSMAASGGYYVAAASDEILANRNTWTGSIGVTLGTLFDVSGFLEEHGIRTETITSGRNKAMGSYYEPMTSEQKEIFQSLVDDAYEQFVAIVAEGRGMSLADVRVLADGRIYTATQALEAGLIDGIAGEKEAEDAVKEKFEEDVSFVYCYYKPDASYLSLFATLLESGSGSGSRNAGARGGGNDVSGSSFYDGDVAAVLELVREYEGTGIPPLRYQYAG